MKPTCIIFDTSRQTWIELFEKNWDIKWKIYPIYMTHVFRNAHKVLNLLGIRDLSRTHELAFWFIDQWGKIEQFKISQDTKERILEFLSQTNTDESKNQQDCMQFAKWLVGEWKSQEEFQLENYELCKIDDIDADWIILLLSDTNHHGAIYLWKWIYISRFWVWWPIGWASIEQLIDIYKPDEIIAWNKKTITYTSTSPEESPSQQ